MFTTTCFLLSSDCKTVIEWLFLMNYRVSVNFLLTFCWKFIIFIVLGKFFDYWHLTKGVSWWKADAILSNIFWHSQQKRHLSRYLLEIKDFHNIFSLTFVCRFHRAFSMNFGRICNNLLILNDSMLSSFLNT